VAATGAKKAAMLLMSLDPPTAAELLQSARPETITQIAAELACLGDEATAVGRDAEETIREFYGLLSGNEPRLGGQQFAKQMLKIVLGEQELEDVLTQVDQEVWARDPFREIRDASVSDIAAALAGESTPVVSLVLSELPPKKSVALLGELDEAARGAAIACMAVGEAISAEARIRIASVVEARLAEKGKGGTMGAEQADTEQLRKVAVLLRGLEVEARNGLVSSLTEQNEQAAKDVQDLMVIWEDMIIISERSLQEVLRSVDSRKLALALVEAGDLITAKVRDNISDRAKEMLDEEAGLLSSPKASEVEEAREEILKALRDMNAQGELQFEEE